MRSDNDSAKDDRDGTGAVPWQLHPQKRGVAPGHPQSSASHRSQDETQRRRGDQLSFLGRQRYDTPNKYRQNDAFDVKTMERQEEYISVEMMFENRVSLENCKCRAHLQPKAKRQQQKPSDYCNNG
jgi:hypothetical protein